MKKPRWYLSWTPWPVSGKTTLYLGELPMWIITFFHQNNNETKQKRGPRRWPLIIP
jgi:hypothetical protein